MTGIAKPGPPTPRDAFVSAGAGRAPQRGVGAARGFAYDLEPYIDDAHAILNAPDYFHALLIYILAVCETPSDELRTFFASLGNDIGEAYVTTAEMLRAQGRAEGEARGRAAALAQLLTLRFGPLPQTALDTVHAASIDQLAAWTAHVLTADTLDQVLR